MPTKPLTENEKKIIEILRSLKPFEKIEITADKNGKVDTFYIFRSQKFVLERVVINSKI